MPITFENDVMGMLTKQDWLQTGESFSVQTNDAIDGLFGDDKTDNLVASWEMIASQYKIPMMAQFHGFDTETQQTFRVPVDHRNIEKGLIKVKAPLSERLRALLRSTTSSEQIYDFVVNDGLRLASQVVTRTKVAKYELMATGKITIKENNIDLTVDYGVDAENTGFTIDFSEDADVGAQVNEIVKAAREKGVNLTGMLTSGDVFDRLLANKSLQIAILGVNAVGVNLMPDQINDYFRRRFGITTIITNDQYYGVSAEMEAGRPKVTTGRYYPANKITFFATNPSGKIGTGLWGDPPEVDVKQIADVSASNQSPFVYISQYIENDPAVLWTKASGLFIPVLYDPNSLFIATVADEGMNTLTVAAADSGTDFWGTTASQMQSGVTVANNAITGTLTKLTSGQLVNDWGAGYFLGLKWSGIDPNATSVKVGLQPSEGTGMVEAINDPDSNGVFKITNKNIQKFKAVVSNKDHATVQEFDLSGLTLS